MESLAAILSESAPSTSYSSFYVIASPLAVSSAIVFEEPHYQLLNKVTWG